MLDELVATLTLGLLQDRALLGRQANNPGLLITFLASLFGAIVIVVMQNGWVWALVACTIAAVSEGFLSGSAVKARLAEVRLPKRTPPLWVWSVIGAAYYILFFFVLKSLLDHPPVPYWTSIGLTLSAVMLAANATWNWVFFRKQDCWLSFVFFVPYLLLAVALAVVLYRIRNPFFGWYAVYLAYLVYATWWGHRVWDL